MLRTKSGLPKGCCWNLDRENGKTRVRFRDRRSGFSVYLTGTPWSEDFMRQYAAALDGGKAKRVTIIGAKRTSAGTINALIVSYYASTAFKDTKASTQTNRRNILERFRAGYGDLPVKGLTRAVLDKIMSDRANTPMAANNLMKVLRYLLEHAVAHGVIAINPTIGVRRYRNKGEGHHPWREEEIAQYLARHPFDTRAGLAVAFGIHLHRAASRRRRRHGLEACRRRHDRGPAGEDRHAADDPAASRPVAGDEGAAAVKPRLVPRHRARQIVHVGRFRQLVQRSMRRGRAAALLIPRAAPCGGDPSGEHRLHRRGDHGDHRASFQSLACGLHTRRRPAAVSPAGDGEADWINTC